MNKLTIMQARMTSTRLPGKVLKKVLGKPILFYQIERLRRVKLTDNVIIATTENAADDPIVDFCRSISLPFYRGSENDVLSRYYETAKDYNADVVIRVTSDCPLIDPKVIDSVIKQYLDYYPLYDYVSNTITRTYPRGMDTEVFSFNALEKSFHEATSTPEREHVTPFIYRHPECFKISNVLNMPDQSRHRWTVDTEEDFDLVNRIIGTLYPNNPLFSMEDVLKLMEDNPDWFYINAYVEQKV